MYGSHQVLWLALLVSASCMTVLCHGQEQLPSELPKQPRITPIPPTPLSMVDDLPLPLTAEWGYTPIDEFAEVTSEDLVAPVPTSPPASVPPYTVALSSPPACVPPLANKKDSSRFFDLQKHYRHPSTFRPHGDAVNSAFAIQIENGHAARTILYKYDFYRANASLHQRGYLELLEIAERVSRTPYPLVIEASGDAALDAARRATVIEHLAKLPFGIPEERVLIDIPLVAGLDGIDAVLAHEGLLQLSTYGRGNNSNGSSSAVPFDLPTGQ